ncbi:mammalian cell entry protein [Mycolicibacterium anyangense]|uniref:Mammalian cell entry protein n=1 Tax=Mycolicibacterium anyangense TaxID=1431246 RepID=A0A6N4WAH9_9MYCO|nr:MCE family protein [Mycolicibacterium anyangense]BBZ78049.1 mammalian cell entry protein [Mycolicibacterium anyangense]
MSKRRAKVLSVVLAGLLVVGTAVLVRNIFFGPKTISALFTTATGIYPGDDVRVSGVKVGTIDAIEPQGTQTKLVLHIDRDVPIPADAKAVIVAQNLVAARYVQLTPAYRKNTGQKEMAVDTLIPSDRTAIPVEWDEVKEQLTRLATDLGPQNGVSGTSVSRFIDSAANALDGNGDKLRQTITELAGVSRVLANGSGNIVDIIKNLQTFITTLRESNEQVVMFQNRLATLTSVIDGNRSDLDAALKNLSVAIVDIQRFVAGSRNQTSEQLHRLTNVTTNLLNNKMEIENLLHIAPNALANAYNIYNPSTGSAVGQFVLNDFSNPTEYICGAIGAIENTTAPETAKLCSQYLGPALRLLNFNYLPIPVDPYLMPAAAPDELIYSQPNLAPGAGGPTPDIPPQPPHHSAYEGVLPGPPGFTGRAPGEAPPGAAQLLPGGSPAIPPSVISSLPSMLNPAAAPGPAPSPPMAAEAGGTP